MLKPDKKVARSDKVYLYGTQVLTLGMTPYIWGWG